MSTLLTEPEAAQRLRIGERTLRKLRQAGAIRYIALTKRKVAYRAEDCDEYIEAQVTRAEPDAIISPQPKARRSASRRGVVVPFSQQV